MPKSDTYICCLSVIKPSVYRCDLQFMVKNGEEHKAKLR